MNAFPSMHVADVNILVSAQRSDAAHHEQFRSWLEDARSGDVPLGLAENVLAGFVRIVTHSRIFREPTPLESALAFAEALRSSPAARILRPGDRHWPIFVDLCRRTDSRGNHVPDAYLAALVIEQAATLVTADRGFGRFRGLRWEHPLDRGATT